MHFPGMNYMGPGTHIISNILNEKAPVSRIDAIALKHDIEYLTDGEKYAADLSAIYESSKGFSNPLQALAMRLGLSIRMVGDLITHVIPYAPKLHFNKDAGLTKNQISYLKMRANKLLKPYNLEYDDIN